MSSSFVFRRAASFCALLGACLLPLLPRVARAASAEPPVFLCGMIVTVHDDGRRITVPLESTHVALHVTPGLLEAEVTQTFTNRTAVALEATYLYPLPGDATLTNFELRFRDRVVRSEVREKSAARATYEAAKAEGRKTALLEQRDPSLFSTAVANFLPGETVKVVLRFTQPLRLRADACEVRFPMVTSQKYFPADTTPGSAGNAAPDPARRSGDPTTPDHFYAFDVHVSGIPIARIASPSHRIQVERVAGTVERHRASLAETIAIPDRDFVLRIDTRIGDAVQPTVVTQRTATGDYGLLTVFPSRDGGPGNATTKARDVLFLLDRSGSMAGARLESAKRGLETCLGALTAADRFQIALFDDRVDFHGPDWLQGNPESLHAARTFVRGIQTRGGTEMQPALAACLDRFGRNDRQQILILLTDGDVGNAASLLNLIEAKIGQVRLFPLGIGAAPNATLLQEMAERGRGEARFISDDSSIAEELADLFLTLDAPVLTDVSLTLLGGAGQTLAHQMFPERLPDVFARRPIQTVFRTTAGVPAAVRIDGLENGRPVSRQIALQATPLPGDGIEKQFGQRLFKDTGVMLRRAKTDEERTLVRNEMLATALQFQLVTELTSRVAVDQELARDPSAPLATEHVAQYHAIDHGAAGAAGDVVTLMPFEMRTDGDRGYMAGSTIAGTRAATSLHVLTKEHLIDFPVVSLEAALPLALDVLDAATARAGSRTVLLDGLPLVTVVDPETVRQIAWHPIAPGWTEIAQSAPARGRRSTLTMRVGDEGAASVTLRSSLGLAHGELPTLLLLSWTKLLHEQRSAFLAAQKTFGTTTVRASAQARELENYGSMRLARADVEHPLGATARIELRFAWHELRRDDPAQFWLGSPTRHYENLGFLAMDLLTAETRRLADRLAQVGFSGRTSSARSDHTWSALYRWQERESDWSLPRADLFRAKRRTSHELALQDRVALAGERVHLGAQLAWAQHATPGSTRAHERTWSIAGEMDWKLGEGLALFAKWADERALPWLATGRWQLGGAGWLAVAPAIEKRRGAHAGVRFTGHRERLKAEAGLFREDVRDASSRDWAWEATHAGAELVSLPGGELRGNVSTQATRFARAGGLAAVAINPTPAFTLRAAWFEDWENAGPERGGNRRGSIAARYELDPGPRHRVSLGVSLSYRNALTVADGVILAGGVRPDAMLGYAVRRAAGGETRVQLNLDNIARRAGPPTRFSPDLGRTVRLSVAHDF